MSLLHVHLVVSVVTPFFFFQKRSVSSVFVLVHVHLVVSLSLKIFIAKNSRSPIAWKFNNRSCFWLAHLSVKGLISPPFSVVIAKNVVLLCIVSI